MIHNCAILELDDRSASGSAGHSYRAETEQAAKRMPQLHRAKQSLECFLLIRSDWLGRMRVFEEHRTRQAENCSSF